MTTEQFIDKARQLHSDKYDYSKTEYTTSRGDVTIICPEHGEFTQRASSHLQGNGCPACAKEWSEERKRNHLASSRRNRGMTTDEWIERAKAIHGDRYDYSQTVYVNQRTKVKIICPEHGMFEQNADSHLRGCGCRLCGIQSENRKGVHSWSSEQHAKTRATCMERYGAPRYLDSQEGKEKLSQIKAAPEFRKKMSEIISSDEVQEKTKQTSLERYGVEFPMQLDETVLKVAEAKRRNGTWSTSKPEENMYAILCDKFGESDVVRQYREARYPFHCDFYISSLDLFIELNATWLHGEHWFDPTSDEDMRRLTDLQAKVAGGSRFYEVAIDVWTVRDVLKRQTAIDNDLNYVAFWKSDLSDFKDWIESDELVLNNIL